MLDDASIVFLSFRLGEILFVPDEGYGIKLNVHEFVSEIIQSLSINLVDHGSELEQMATLRLQIRSQVPVI